MKRIQDLVGTNDYGQLNSNRLEEEYPYQDSDPNMISKETPSNNYSYRSASRPDSQADRKGQESFDVREQRFISDSRKHERF